MIRQLFNVTLWLVAFYLFGLLTSAVDAANC
jgi:hypothetical protein